MVLFAPHQDAESLSAIGVEVVAGGSDEEEEDDDGGDDDDEKKARQVSSPGVRSIPTSKRHVVLFRRRNSHF